MSVTSTTFLTFPIEIKYEVLPEEDGLPEQIDITDAIITVTGPTGRKRKVNLIYSLSESEIIAIEDEIQETGNGN